MRQFTRRSALRGGLGAGLAVALSPVVTGSPAVGAVGNRVRVTTGTAYGAARTSIGATFPAPAQGNLLIAIVSVDGSAGMFKVPAGWKLAFQRVGTSLSLAALYRPATGGETAVTLAWSIASPGGSWIVAEYTGINLADPLGPVRNPAYSDTLRTTMTLNPPAAESASIQLAVFGIDAMDAVATGPGGPEFRPTAPGWDWIITSSDPVRPACPGTALTEYGAALTAGQDLAGSRFAWRRQDQVIGGLLQLNTAATAPSLVSRWVGAVTTTGATVAVKVRNASTALLKVSTDPGLTTDVAHSPGTAPDANGMAKLSVDGLTPGTRYYYAVQLDGSVDSPEVGSFRTSPGTAAGFRFAFGSCCNSPGASTFTEIGGHDPDLFIHLGDLFYGDIAVNDPAPFRGRFDTALASAYQGPLYANVPTVYTWSDHDFGPNGSDGTSVSKPAAQATYRQYVPSYPLPSSTGGIYHTFAYGRVRFIATDNRSYKSPRSLVDDAAKTMLGAEQKEWFKATIAAATEPVIIWINENPWISDPARTQDWWGGYSTERAELASFIAGSGKKVAIVSGDMHALAADDGTHSPGGIPVFQAAALNQNSSHKGGPYTHGPFPATVGVPVQQYGVMDVVDTGATIELQFTGHQVGVGPVLTYTHTFTL